MILTLVLTSLRGFAMGAADIVPGVSGGTIALVLGIYERLVASIRAGSSALGHLVKGDFVGFRRWMATVEWLFILPLGFGVLLAVATLAQIIEHLLTDQPVLMASIFLGLVAGSVVVALRLLKHPTLSHAWIIIVTGVVVFVLLGLRGGTTEDTVGQVADPALWAFFLAGAVAICAMILPGVSGSFLLVVLGMYGPVLGAVTDRDFVALGVFLVGTVVGLALFSQILDRALRSHHDVVLATLIGLMAGSVRVLWPWPLGVDSTVLGQPDGDVAIAVVAALIGFVFVVVFARAAQDLESSEAPPGVAD
jgi:putative membrane protein